jgi:hypothetical protein
MDVELTTETAVHADVSNLTVAPEIKFEPVIVIDVPPAKVPSDNDRLVTTGVGRYI